MLVGTVMSDKDASSLSALVCKYYSAILKFDYYEFKSVNVNLGPSCLNFWVEPDSYYI